MRRAVTALVSTVAVVAAGVAATVPSPASAAESVPGIGGYTDMAVDEAHDTVLVTQGNFSSDVAVLDLDGTPRTSIGGMSTAMDVQLSADGSVFYISLEGQHAIAVVDAATLAVTKIPLGDDVCPTSVAEDDGVLWFAHTDCVVTLRAVGSVRLDDGVVTKGLRVDGVQWPTRLESSPGLPGRLVVAHSNELAVLDVSGGPMTTPIARVRAETGSGDFRITPDGLEVVTTVSGPSRYVGLSTSDLSERTVYPIDHMPNAVAVRADGMVAAGRFGSGRDVLLYPEGSSTLYRSYDTGSPASYLVEHGLEFGARDLYVVSRRFDGVATPYEFQRITPRLETSMTIATNATTLNHGSTARVTARVSWPGAPVDVYATSYGGSRRLLKHAVADASGTVTASTPVYARTTFEAVYVGDDERDGTSASVTMAVRAAVTETVTKVVGRSGSYRLVRSGTKPSVLATVRPNQAGKCLKFQFEEPTPGGNWAYSRTTSCAILGSTSQAYVWFNATWVPGSRVRVRAIWPGNAKSAAQTSSWVYVKFVR